MRAQVRGARSEYKSQMNKNSSVDPSERLARYLAVAGDFYPHVLQDKFPRIVERLVAVWEYPPKALAFFEELLIDQRGDRQGFAPEIAREIFQLRIIYETFMAAPSGSDDVWRHEKTAQQALQELGMKIVPADLSRAAERGDVKTIGLLLRAGLDVDARDVRDWTPLMVAAFRCAQRLSQNASEPGCQTKRQVNSGLIWCLKRKSSRGRLSSSVQPLNCVV